MKFNVDITLMDNYIDFKVMGLDDTTSEFLNKCMKNRDNLEYEFDCGVHNIISGSSTLFFDDLGGLARVDNQLVNRRNIVHFVEIKTPLDKNLIKE